MAEIDQLVVCRPDMRFSVVAADYRCWLAEELYRRQSVKMTMMERLPLRCFDYGPSSAPDMCLFSKSSVTA